MKTILNLLICVSLNSLFIASVYAQDEISSAELEQQLARTSSMDSNRIKPLIQLSNRYIYSEPDKAITYTEEAIAIARQVSNNKLLKVFVTASAIWLEMGRYQQAAIVLREAMHLTTDYKDTESAVKLRCNLGVLYNELGASEKAEECFTEAYDIAVRENVDELIMNSTFNIGALCSEIDHDEKAIRHFNKAIQLAIKLKRWEACALAYSNMGAIYGHIKAIDKANLYFDSCQAIINTHKLKPDMQLTLYVCKAEMSDPYSNIKVINNFLNSHISNTTDAGMMDVYHILADAYFKTNQFDDALKQAQAGVTLQKELEVIDATYLDDCQIIANVHLANKNWAEACKWQKEIITMRDTLDMQNHRRTVTLALVSHEIESKEKELQERNNQLRIRQRVYEISAIAAAIILLVLGSTFYYRIRLRRSLEEAKLKAQYTEQLEEEVKARVKELEQVHTQIQEAKERENISLALLNQRHAELLEHITQKLKAWQEQELITDTQATRPLLNDIRTAQSQAEEWGSFMLHFERMHPEFTDKLKQYASDLKLSDLKHCAYMRLGMTRKQVAETLHCSEEAVKQARNKVRKKLGLSPDASLQDFINQF